MKLSKRLETIVEQAALVCGGETAADVGTDHGFVPIRLIEERAADRVIAMDVRKGPLMRAQEHVIQFGMEEQIETRLSDGLEKLMPGEAKTVIIAGMGGELMLRILRDGEHVRKEIRHWILSPQSELSQFRHGLEELGLAIIREEMVEEDGKYYTILTAEPGQMHYEKESDYRYGALLIQEKSPVLAELLERELTQYRQILEHLKQQKGEGPRLRAVQIQEEIRQMEEARNAMQTVD